MPLLSAAMVDYSYLVQAIENIVPPQDSSMASLASNWWDMTRYSTTRTELISSIARQSGVRASWPQWQGIHSTTYDVMTNAGHPGIAGWQLWRNSPNQFVRWGPLWTIGEPEPPAPATPPLSRWQRGIYQASRPPVYAEYYPQVSLSNPIQGYTVTQVQQYLAGGVWLRWVTSNVGSDYPGFRSVSMHPNSPTVLISYANYPLGPVHYNGKLRNRRWMYNEVYWAATPPGFPGTTYEGLGYGSNYRLFWTENTYQRPLGEDVFENLSGQLFTTNPGQRSTANFWMEFQYGAIRGAQDYRVVTNGAFVQIRNGDVWTSYNARFGPENYRHVNLNPGPDGATDVLMNRMANAGTMTLSNGLALRANYNASARSWSVTQALNGEVVSHSLNSRDNRVTLGGPINQTYQGQVGAADSGVSQIINLTQFTRAYGMPGPFNARVIVSAAIAPIWVRLEARGFTGNGELGPWRTLRTIVTQQSVGSRQVFSDYIISGSLAANKTIQRGGRAIQLRWQLKDATNARIIENRGIRMPGSGFIWSTSNLQNPDYTFEASDGSQTILNQGLGGGWKTGDHSGSVASSDLSTIAGRINMFRLFAGTVHMNRGSDPAPTNPGVQEVYITYLLANPYTAVTNFQVESDDALALEVHGLARTREDMPFAIEYGLANLAPSTTSDPGETHADLTVMVDPLAGVDWSGDYDFNSLPRLYELEDAAETVVSGSGASRFQSIGVARVPLTIEHGWSRDAPDERHVYANGAEAVGISKLNAPVQVVYKPYLKAIRTSGAFADEPDPSTAVKAGPEQIVQVMPMSSTRFQVGAEPEIEVAEGLSMEVPESGSEFIPEVRFSVGFPYPYSAGIAVLENPQGNFNSVWDTDNLVNNEEHSINIDSLTDEAGKYRFHVWAYTPLDSGELPTEFPEPPLGMSRASRANWNNPNVSAGPHLYGWRHYATFEFEVPNRRVELRGSIITN